MIVKIKTFSGETIYLPEEDYLNELMYSENDDDSLFEEERDYSVESKALGFFAPGAYQAKEAAKYAYDKDEYKKHRAKYALLGAFTPGTATIVKKKAENMAREGKSKKEIRKYLENPKAERYLAGIGENVLLPGVGSLAATGVGIADKIQGNRAWDKKEGKSKKRR